MTREAKETKEVGVSDLTVDSLMCRDLRHSWRHQNDYSLLKVKGSPEIVLRVLSCDRCTATREDTFRADTFEVVRTKVVYPKGYLTKNVGRVRVSEVRTEYYSRGRVNRPRRGRA